MGNPTTYKNEDLQWSYGRNLRRYGNNIFEYGADNIRYKKNNTVYTLDGSTILKETDGTKTITYYYGNGGVIGFNYNGTDYFYEKNLQGDVIAIYNSNGEKQAEYVYDAWGKILDMRGSDNIHIINPFRYRGYYYDVETDLYYLESRYYDPETGRFLNADNLDYLGEGNDLQNYNLYSYCENNPVMYADSSGHSVSLALILGGTFLLGFGSSLFINAATNNWQLDWRDFGQAIIDGVFAVGGTLLAMTSVGFWISVGCGAVMGFGQYALGSLVQGTGLTLSGSLTAIAFGALGGGISGAGATNAANISKNMVELSDDGVRAIGAITKAINRFSVGQISRKGVQATLNLYGKTAFNAVQSAIYETSKKIFLDAVKKIMIYTPLANLAQGGLNYGYGVWRWI